MVIGPGYRAIYLQATAHNRLLVERSGYIHAIITTTVGAAGYRYTLFDGTTAGTTILWAGGTLAVNISDLRIPIGTGLYIVAAGGATQAEMVIVVGGLE